MASRLFARVLRSLRVTVACLTAAVTVASCGGIWEEQTSDCEPRQEFDVKLHFSVSFTNLIHFTARSAEQPKFRVVVYAYPSDGESSRNEMRIYGPPAHTFKSFTNLDKDVEEQEIDLSLTAGEWDLMVWADYFDEANDFEYYDYTDFSEITINESTGHRGCDEYRDAFRGIAHLNIDELTEGDIDVDVVIDMVRPLAKYTFITTDIDEFTESQLKTQSKGDLYTEDIDAPQKKVIDLNNYTVRFYYTGFMPSAYNMFYDRPSNALTGIYYDGKITQISDTEAQIGFDYVFVNSDDSSVAVAVAVYDRNGDCISVTSSYEIPLVRNQETAVRGKFLTSTAGSSASIESEFTGDFNIKIQ